MFKFLLAWDEGREAGTHTQGREGRTLARDTKPVLATAAAEPLRARKVPVHEQARDPAAA